MPARSSHSRSASTGGPTGSTLPASSAATPSWFGRLARQARQGGDCRVSRVERPVRLVADLLHAGARHVAASSSARGERQEQDCQIQGIDKMVGTARREQPVEHAAGDGPLALALPRPGAGPDRQPERRTKTGRWN
ncbi:MAG: hypothetical protein ABIO35_00765, partial [Nitrobacter sp.]